jgi:hypothetical protein
MEVTRDTLLALWTELGKALGQSVTNEGRDILAHLHECKINTLDELKATMEHTDSKLRERLEAVGLDADDLPDFNEYDLSEIEDAYAAKEKLSNIADYLSEASRAIESAEGEL